MKTFLFDLNGTLLAANENDFMHAFLGELIYISRQRFFHKNVQFYYL
jgi:hypothetical protein